MFLIYINEPIAILENTTLKLNCLRMMLSYTSESLMNLILPYSNQHSTLGKAALILGSYPFPLTSVVY